MRFSLLKDVFLWAYERSAARYAAIRQSLGEPDPFKLKYRNEIRELITSIIMDAIPSKEASRRIEAQSAKLPETDRSKFIHAVETELMALHEGNYARYRVSPKEFGQWKAVW